MIPSRHLTYVFAICMTLAEGMLCGCKTRLAEPSPYAGDESLYLADQAIVAAADALDQFTRWEYEHRQALAPWPEIRRTADYIRANARSWIESAMAIRSAYAAAPTDQNRAALQRALRTINEAVSQALVQMTRAGFAAANETSTPRN